MVYGRDNLSQAAFTVLTGVDSYYLTKAIMNKQTRLRYVSEEENTKATNVIRFKLAMISS